MVRSFAAQSRTASVAIDLLWPAATSAAITSFEAVRRSARGGDGNRTADAADARRRPMRRPRTRSAIATVSMPITTSVAPSSRWPTSFMRTMSARRVPGTEYGPSTRCGFSLLRFGHSVTLDAQYSYLHSLRVTSKKPGIRTTIYLAAPAATVLDQVKSEYRDRYGIAISVSAVLARLLLGETVDEVIERPFRTDLTRITKERDLLVERLQRARARRRTDELHEIQRAIAALYPRVKEISMTLERARRRQEPYSPDYDEAGRIERSLDELMKTCTDAIMLSRGR